MNSESEDRSRLEAGAPRTSNPPNSESKLEGVDSTPPGSAGVPPALVTAVSPSISNSKSDLSNAEVGYVFAVIISALLLYYGPALIGAGDFYISDLTFYFQPFSQFAGGEILKGILPLWNPHLYSGMSQLAVPSPAIFYPPSLLLFLLPFSTGLSFYMIMHQMIGAFGAFLYLRELNISRGAAAFGAVAFSLCAYMFSLIQNFTLPATVCWLPLALYFLHRISPRRNSSIRIVSATSGGATGSAAALRSPAFEKSADMLESEAGRLPALPGSTASENGKIWSWASVIGLGFCSTMIVYCGRPEVGIPCLGLLVVAALCELYARWAPKSSSLVQSLTPLIITGVAMAAGLLMSAPILLPGVEWASASPRSQGMASKWVLLWSANWFDWVGMFLSNPLGGLYSLNESSAHLRHLVLSRGGSLPFVGSCFVSSIVLNFAICGLFIRNKKLLYLLAFILFASVLMALGSATPFAPFLVGLSPFFAAFRYPVKLLIVPAILLIFLATLGFELVLQKELRLDVLKKLCIVWLFFVAAGILMISFPQITLPASKILVKGNFPEYTLQTARYGFGNALMISSLIAFSSTLLATAYYKGQLNAKLTALLLTGLLATCLVYSSLSVRLIGGPGYFTNPSFLAAELRKIQSNQSTQSKSPTDRPTQISTGTIDGPLLEGRMLNLYFDPLATPAHFIPTSGSKDFEQKFYQYSREMLLHNTVICAGLSSSYGYEAAETKDYKDLFTEAMLVCSQHRDAKTATMCDRPIHRFALLTSTAFVNTQVYRDFKKDLPLLDPKLFKLLKDDRSRNFRIFQVIGARPRLAFASRVVPIESFADLKKVILETKIVPQTEVFDSEPDMVYVLNRDYQSYKNAFELINDPARNDRGVAKSKPKFEILHEDSQSQAIRLSTDQPELLLLNDHYFPGWVAELDGKPVKILKANGLNRAILIEAGQHTVKLRYSPDSLFIGGSAALLGLVALLSVAGLNLFLWKKLRA